eukprot:3410833-Prymnesium_polylepis.2
MARAQPTASAPGSRQALGGTRRRRCLQGCRRAATPLRRSAGRWRWLLGTARRSASPPTPRPRQARARRARAPRAARAVQAAQSARAVPSAQSARPVQAAWVARSSCAG